MGQLDNKIAIVTGAGGGIGRAISLGFAAEGASVVVSDINAEAAAAVAAEIGDDALANTCDVSQEDQVEAMVAAAIERFGRIDILVNNAGRAAGNLVSRLDITDYERVFAANVRGTLLCSKAVLQHMIPQRSGVIINTASGMATYQRPGSAVYGASKAAVIYITQTTALEVARYGIRVNAFTPGVTDTPFWRAHQTQEGIDEAYRDGKVGQPEDIVPTVILLASDASREISGDVIRRELFVAKGEAE